jgi:citrate lyase subunit beta/citryl-CoA lyase
MEKAQRVPADVLQIDIEDSVTAAQKDAARAEVRSFAERKGPGGKQLLSVKINPLHAKTSYSVGSGLTDLEAVVCAGVDFIAIPKVESPEEVQAVDECLVELEAAAGIASGAIRLIAMIESARGLLAINRIAAASSRIYTLAYTGETDFFATLIAALDSSPKDADYVELAYGRQHTALACMAVPLAPPLDVVSIDIPKTEFLRRSASIARRLGFGGKLCIHPSQVPVINEVFSPTQEEVEWSRRVLEALEEAEARGRAAVAVDRQLVDTAMGPAARRLIERHEAIQARSNI